MQTVVILFNETLILWAAYYKYKYGLDATKIHSMLVFPYNSANEQSDDTWWDDFSVRVSPLTLKDIFVGNQFWSFLTDNPNALNSIISGLDYLTANDEFINLYSQVYECEEHSDLVRFSETVKLSKIKNTLSVEIINHESPMNLRKKFSWKHNETCEFRERLNKLLTSDNYICPTCKAQLST